MAEVHQPNSQAREQELLHRTAIHEAAHAALAIVLGRPFRSVTIVPKDGMLGYCSLSRWPKKFQPDINDLDVRMRERLEATIISSLAGEIAETHMYGPAWVAAEYDRHMAVDLACYCVGSPEELEAYLNWLQIRTEALVRRSKPEIDALAEALLRDQTIQAKRAREIFSATVRSQVRIPMPDDIRGTRLSDKNSAEGR